MNKVREKYINMKMQEELMEMAQIMTQVEKQGLMVEVMHTALVEMKENPQASPLLALQIAMEDWDI
jgi:hypothetical protein|tara:strand:+ start:74 stop:271 length:198 start_codon:yes stop_codon:yes gene_type:complete